ncbi:hypothetical protein [Pectobacterium zantedeschiae]|uniref:Uncharacterized protein n=1 Tax=Pectobacterium zantedeschiae TaxID=2034769 RepID=A0A9X8JK66_9GAMM|nr:hypothetical protein [Pectobacterium zantedeschiae]RYC44609.1 hypothetical protein CLR69_06210 [Pectobacterium zantedeschiae]RYC49767.1 hypothetical protein CTN06_02010 [Pectobacterium zantedeschiae]
MALVKVLVANLFAGASFQKLEVGVVYEVDDVVAEKWVAAGKAEPTKEKGEKLVFEVATLSAPVSNDNVLQSQLNDALEQLNTAHSALEAKDKAHAEVLEQLNIAHAAELTAANARAETAEAALTEATKKAK